MNEIEIIPAKPSEAAAIQELLREASLPSEDIRAHLSHFLVARKGGKSVGTVGLEVYGAMALLRSLVVEEPLRGTGLGKRLYDTIASRAGALGIRELSLLTTTAEGFFGRLGFQKVEGDKIPEYVKNTKEYQVLCPSSAVCMVKRLG